MLKVEIRSIKSSDYYAISPIINEWWDGRQMADMLPKLFFDHFNNTSFIAEVDGKIIGFLVGFLSQTYPNEAYIHFVGIHPDYRKNQVGRKLYHEFFEVVKANGRNVVKAVTSPVNQTSISYHQKMGFKIEESTHNVENVSVFLDYDGPAQHRVLFVKKL